MYGAFFARTLSAPGWGGSATPMETTIAFLIRPPAWANEGADKAVRRCTEPRAGDRQGAMASHAEHVPEWPRAGHACPWKSWRDDRVCSRSSRSTNWRCPTCGHRRRTQGVLGGTRTPRGIPTSSKLRPPRHRRRLCEPAGPPCRIRCGHAWPASRCAPPSSRWVNRPSGPPWITSLSAACYALRVKLDRHGVVALESSREIAWR